MSVAVAAEKQKIKGLRDQLKKENKLLKKLRTKHKEQKKKHKELTAKRKLEEAEKKLVAKALKPYRKVTALNVYIKENVREGSTMTIVGKNWSLLAADEKVAYQAKADAINAEAVKIWTPKPAAQPNSYAAFVKQNWVQGDREFGEVSKELAAKWKELTDSEKAEYGPTDAEKAAYQNELEEWKARRIQLFKESRS